LADDGLAAALGDYDQLVVGDTVTKSCATLPMRIYTYREHGYASAVLSACDNSVGAAAVSPRLANHRHGG